MSNSTKPFSLSLGGSSTQSKKTSFNLQKSSNTSSDPSSRTALPRRPHQLHHDEESDDDADGGAPVHEAVTGFDTLTGTAIAADGSHEKRDLVIPVTSTNNWRDRPGVNLRRGKKNLLPKEVQAIQEAAKRGETAGDNVETERPSMEYGLSFAQRKEDNNVTDTATAVAAPSAGDQPMADAAEQPPRKPLTQDEIALNALIRESKGEMEARSDLVIESAGADGPGERYDETTSFKADVASRPEPASLEQYNAIPVEEFGAALLRGMGWKEGQAVGKGKYGNSASAGADRPRIPERRPGFLGIGAKDSGKGGAEAELGAWGRAAMRKGARKGGKEGEEGNTEGVYMPVMMRNKKTGDFVTEEELALQKKEAAKAKRDEDDWKERRDRNLERSGRDRDRGRDRDSRRRDDRDDEDSDRYDSRRSSRRDRSRSSGDRHSRRRKHDDDDDRYYRDRGSDRERERDRDRARDRDRDRERRRYRDDDRHSSSASSRHGRDRDRDRDSDDSYRRRRHDDRR
jgi:hypothetical protein